MAKSLPASSSTVSLCAHFFQPVDARRHQTVDRVLNATATDILGTARTSARRLPTPIISPCIKLLPYKAVAVQFRKNFNITIPSSYPSVLISTYNIASPSTAANPSFIWPKHPYLPTSAPHLFPIPYPSAHTSESIPPDFIKAWLPLQVPQQALQQARRRAPAQSVPRRCYPNCCATTPRLSAVTVDLNRSFRRPMCGTT